MEEIMTLEEPMMATAPEKCFCHLNGYKVKDADARRMLNGESSMGDIKVSSIASKNLLDIDNMRYEYCTKNNDGSFTANIHDYYFMVFYGTDKLIELFKNSLGKTFSFSVENNYGYTISVVVEGTRSNGLTCQEANTTGNHVTIKIADNFTSISSIQFRVLRSTSKFSDTTSVIRNLQLEFGTAATEYAPYFELATKDYIDGTSPMGNIRVGSIKGKNLFDLNKYETKGYGLGFDISKLEIGKTYTISSNKPLTWIKISNISGGYPSVQFSDENGFLKYTFIMSRNENIPNNKQQYLFLQKEGIDSFIEDIAELDGYEIQIEEGSIATEYVPYFEINKDCGYHVIEMNLGSPVTSIPFGELSFDLNSTNVDKLSKFINDVNKSNINKPILKIVNTNQTAIEEYAMPTEITYINSSTPIKNIQPNYMLFGVTLQLADMLWRSKLEIKGEWTEDVYVCSSASITLYEEVKSSASTSVPIYLLEHTDGTATTTDFKIGDNTIFSNKVKEIINNCYANNINMFTLKLFFNKSSVTNFYGRTIEITFKIDGDNLRILNNYSIAPYDTYYTRYLTTTNSYFSNGSLVEDSSTGIFKIVFKENTQIVAS